MSDGRNVAKPRETIASRISNEIRQAILRGEMPPDSKINLERIRETHDIGVGSVREAVSRLVSDGLVQFQDQRGYRVAPISMDNLIEVTRLRTDLESLALRYSIEGGDIEWESGVLSALHRLNRIQRDVASERSVEEWEEAHTAFHLQLISGGKTPLLVHFCKVLHNLNVRYRRLFLTANLSRRDIRAEHAAIAEAAVARDAEAACSALRRHIEGTGDSLRRRLASLSPESLHVAEAGFSDPWT